MYYLTFQQYESLVKFDIEEIRTVVKELCPVEIDPEWQLDDFRRRLETMKEMEVCIINIFSATLEDLEVRQNSSKKCEVIMSLPYIEEHVLLRIDVPYCLDPRLSEWGFLSNKI